MTTGGQAKAAAAANAIPAKEHGAAAQLKPGDIDRQDSVFDEKVVAQVVDFTPRRLAEFLYNNGAPKDVAELFIKHDITGKLAPLIQEKHLQEMGIQSIGIRLQVIHILSKIKSGQRNLNRNKVIFESLEFRQNTNAPCCPFVPNAFPCCCFLPPLRNIKLTRNNLQISGVQKSGCCEYTYYALCGCIASPPLDVDNIDLSRVTDINRIKKGRECCQVSQSWIQVISEDQDTDALENDKKYLKFTNEDGPKFERMLRNAIEETQEFRGFKR